MLGYGSLIRTNRLAAGMPNPGDLAKRLRKADGKRYSAASVYAWENETSKNPPDYHVINQLASILPVSAETLLMACGVRLSPPEAARLPENLVATLLKLNARNLQAIELAATGLARNQEDQAGRGSAK